MFHILSIIIISFFLSSCSAPSKTSYDLAKLQPNERVYTGNIQVTLNGKTNADLTCDLFLNSDIAPMVRLTPSGDYIFKSNRKTLALTRIACIHKIGNKSIWAKQSLNLKRIERPAQSDHIHHLDHIVIQWTIPEEELQADDIDVFGSNTLKKNIGTIDVKSLPYSETLDQQ